MGNYLKSRNYSHRLSENMSCDISEKYHTLPWCFSRGACRKRKFVPRIKSLYPVRNSVQEYLRHDNNNFDVKTEGALKTRVKVRSFKPGYVSLLLSLLLALGLILAYFQYPHYTIQADLVPKILPETNLISFLSMDCKPGEEECCHRMKQLTLSLRRAEQALSKALRVRNTTSLSKHLDDELKTHRAEPSKAYIEGTKAFMGSDTLEWRAEAYWWFLPLWLAAPRPDVVLSPRRPVPSDCWPFRGSRGEIIIELPENLPVDFISLEHIRPDLAQSAPKHFTVYGILENGTWILAADGIYQNEKVAKQYFHLDNRNNLLQQVVLRVKSNHGNPNYTCIYRINLYPAM